MSDVGKISDTLNREWPDEWPTIPEGVTVRWGSNEVTKAEAWVLFESIQRHRKWAKEELAFKAREKHDAEVWEDVVAGLPSSLPSVLGSPRQNEGEG